MPVAANSIPAVVALLKGAAKDLDALPKKPTLAQLSRFLSGRANRAAYDAFLQADAVTPAFKDKIGKRVGLYRIGLEAIPELVNQLPAIVARLDDDERKLLAFRVLRELPQPAGSEEVAGIDVLSFAPLAEREFATALGQLHGAVFVHDLRMAVRRHASRAMVDDGRAWDVAWAMYAHAAAEHLPFITLRPVNADSAAALDDLGGAHEFVTPDADATADRVAALSL